MLAISAAFDTPRPSSSVAQLRASSAGSAGGIVQPSWDSIAARLIDAPPRSSKKWCEKKWTWPSETARSPQGVCIGLVPVGDARGQSQLREAGYVVYSQLLHHGLTVAAHGLQSQVEHDRDVLARLAFGHQA